MPKMKMKIEPKHCYSGGNFVYNQPVEIGCYSINSDGKFHDSNEELKYLAMPDKLSQLDMDLNEGYSTYIHIHEDTENTFTTILRWILSHEEVITQNFPDRCNSNSRLDFVCFRGLLTSVSATLYQKIGDWMIYATKFRSVVYMLLMTRELKAEKKEHMGAEEKRMATWGFKFEQYMTSDTIDSKPNTSVPVNENEKDYAVMKGELNNHHMLFGAEVDCVDPNYFKDTKRDPKSTDRYVELKTAKIISEKQEWKFIRYKLIRWYLQSHFAGVPRLICGFRDDRGIVRKLHDYKVEDMPEKAAGIWSSTHCMNFCSRFLSFVKTCGMKDDPRVTYKILWKSGSDVSCEKLLPSEYQLLPDWYIEAVNVI